MTATVSRTGLRSKVAAFFIGAAVVAGANIATTLPADAGVRPAVGGPLKDAQGLAASGNYSAAMAKIRQAEGVGGLTGEESRVIAQMKAYVTSRSSGGGDTPRGKFSADYRAGRWGAVIADGEALRRNGQLDGTSMAAVATAYYRSGNYKGCLSYIRGNFGSSPGDTVLQIQVACAFGAQDDESQRSALEQLVARNNTPQYWSQLLKVAERMRAMSDHQTLDIYRLKLLTGTPMVAQDYTLLAKLCLEFNLATEAQNALQKGVDAKLLTDTTSTPRLLTLAKTQAAQSQANVGGRLAAAKAAPTGDPLVKLGEDLTGQGKYQDAVTVIQMGLKKDKLESASSAQLRLGQAYLGAGQKDAAIKAFAKVQGNPNDEKIAHLWTLYARK